MSYITRAMATPLKNENSRERILDAAAEEFAACGFAGARVDRISRRTRLNVRMIYYHFGSKRALYRAVLQHIYERMSQILEASQGRRDAAEAALGMYFDLLTAQPLFADVLVRELLDGARHLRALWKERPELFKQVHVHARELVQKGVRDGELRELDPAQTVLTLTSVVCFLAASRHAHALLLDGRDPPAAESKRHLMTLLFDGIRRRER
jgi:TetR/AcrR family transcriptional regulator